MNEVALSCSSKATGRPQALSRRNTLQVVGGGEPALVGNDVMLGAVAGGDVVLGDDRHEVGAVDAEYFLGLALGDERTERKGFGVSGRWGVHGVFLCTKKKRRQ